MKELSPVQIVFIIVVPILVMILGYVFIALPLIKKTRNTKYREYYYKRIREICDKKNYYLINNFKFKPDNKHLATIDHIIGADKYIYIILDHHVDGHLSGRKDDREIIINLPTGERRYYPNPLLEVDELARVFSICTGIDYSLLIGIAIINNEFNCGIESDSYKNYIIQRNNLAKLIEKIESREIPNINETQLARAINALSKMNLRDRLKKDA